MDEIQQKLAAFDAQLAGEGGILRRIIERSPLIFAGVGLIAGIALQGFISRGGTAEVPVASWVFLLVVCGVVCVSGFLLSGRGKSKRRLYVSAIAAAVCFVCLGAIRFSHYNRVATNDISRLVGEQRRLATVRGYVVSRPYIKSNSNWAFAKFRPYDAGSSFYLRVSRARGNDGWAQVDGVVRVQAAEPVLDLQVGDYIQMYCWLERFHPASNPGQFDIAEYMKRRRVHVAASVKTADGIEVLKSCGEGFLTSAIRKVRLLAVEGAGGLSREGPGAGLVEALLVGRRGNIDGKTYEAFRQTGLLHFISLSGLHLGILAGFVWFLSRRAGLWLRGSAVVCALAVVLFVLVVPPRPPTIRAAIIVWFFCLSVFLGRRGNPVNTLSLAAIVLLLIRPTNLFEAGWQLSFASVLGILLFSRRIDNFLRGFFGSWFSRSGAAAGGVVKRVSGDLGSFVLSVFSVGLAAWTGGAGVLLYHFGTINPFTCVWTVAAFPLVAAILVVGYLKLIMYFVLPAAAAVLGVLSSGMSALLAQLVRFIAQYGPGEFLIGNVSAGLILLYYTLVLVVGGNFIRRVRIKKVVLGLMGAGIVFWLGSVKCQQSHRDELVMTVLDVGHGQSIVAEFGGGADMIFDAGSLYWSDIGSKVVCSFLNYAGIDTVEAIVISHDDVDHINGVAEIARKVRPGVVYANEAFFDAAKNPGTAEFLLQYLEKEGIDANKAGDELAVGVADVKVLWPSGKFQRIRLSDNDSSAVILLEFGGKRILLCSDIEEFAQEKLVELYPELNADVVVAPHHGSPTTLSDGFLEAVGAESFDIICSCSERQYKRQEEIKLCTGGRVYYTARDGAVTVRIDKQGNTDVKTFSER